MIQQMSRPLQLLKDTLPETNSQRAPQKNGWLGPESGHNSSQNLHDFQGVQADSFREGIPPTKRGLPDLASPAPIRTRWGCRAQVERDAEPEVAQIQGLGVAVWTWNWW